MALQVWMPFTDGTLKQQGLSNIIPVGSAFTVNNNGKLGKCIQTTDAGSIDLGYNGNQVNTGSISFGGWFRINKTDLLNKIGSYTYTEVRTTPTGNLIGNNSYGGIGLIWSTNNMYSSGGVLNNLYISCAIRSTQNGARSTNSSEIPFDTWVNIYLVFNKTNKILQLWINGELKQYSSMLTFDDIRDYNLLLNYNAVWGGNGPSFNIPFLTNDIRIYDHALSPMEIKQISQGLILHYNLSDSNIESTTNLITTADCLSNTCFNGATSKYGYGTNTDMYKTVTTFDGRNGTKVYMGTNGNNCYPYVYISNMFTSNGTNSPEYKTLSFDYYTTISTSISPYKLGSGSGTATYKVIADGLERTGTGTNSVVIPIIPNTWNHVEVTFHGTTDADAQWGYIQNQPTHVSNTNNFWFFANMQLETKDHATAYAGVNGSRAVNNIVYDNSGFCNNGTSNNIVISTDTPKYKYSSIFNGSNSYIKVNDNNWMVKGMSEMTVNLWAKATTWPTNGGRLVSCTESGGFNLEAGNSGYWRFPIYVYTNSGQTSSAYKYDSNEIKIADLIPNEWNMITLVYNSTGTKTYLNGELHHTYTNTSYGINFNTNARLFLGCEANTASPYTPYFNGKECDFRIYATALSADDVKSLYQNCATIDPDGTIRGQIRS